MNEQDRQREEALRQANSEARRAEESRRLEEQRREEERRRAEQHTERLCNHATEGNEKARIFPRQGVIFS